MNQNDGVVQQKVVEQIRGILPQSRLYCFERDRPGDGQILSPRRFACNAQKELLVFRFQLRQMSRFSLRSRDRRGYRFR